MKQSDIATILVGVVLVTVTILSVSCYSCYDANSYIMMYQVFLVERLGRKTINAVWIGRDGISLQFDALVTVNCMT